MTNKSACPTECPGREKRPPGRRPCEAVPDSLKYWCGFFPGRKAEQSAGGLFRRTSRGSPGDDTGKSRSWRHRGEHRGRKRLCATCAQAEEWRDVPPECRKFHWTLNLVDRRNNSWREFRAQTRPGELNMNQCWVYSGFFWLDTGPGSRNIGKSRQPKRRMQFQESPFF